MRYFILIFALFTLISCNRTDFYENEELFFIKTNLNKNMFMAMSKDLLEEAGYHIDVFEEDKGLLYASYSGATETKGFSLNVKLLYHEGENRVESSIVNIISDYDVVLERYYDMKRHPDEFAEYFMPVMQKIINSADKVSFPNRP